MRKGTIALAVLLACMMVSAAQASVEPSKKKTSAAITSTKKKATGVKGAVKKGASKLKSLMATARKRLKGSRASAEKQNRVAKRAKLSKMKDQAQIRRFAKRGLLVPIPKNQNIHVDPRLPADYRYCRVSTRRWLLMMSKKFEYQVNSGVRDKARQKLLRRRGNMNTAPVEGPTASSHLYGTTVDITKLRYLDGREVQDMRLILSEMEGANLIEATEEFGQKVFHAFVFPDYGTPKLKAKKVATSKKRPIRSSAKKPKGVRR